MSSLQITLVTLAAVLVFWGVGAYNRLMRLRNALLQGFSAVDQQLKLRHTLLQQQFDQMVPDGPDAADTLRALHAACAQAQAALAHARAHPGSVGALGSLQLAEKILLETRTRLPAADGSAVPAPSEPAGHAERVAQLAATDVALAFARGRFNEAVMEYNHAVRQFPTRPLASLFGFRAAGAL